MFQIYKTDNGDLKIIPKNYLLTKQFPVNFICYLNILANTKWFNLYVLFKISKAYLGISFFF